MAGDEQAPLLRLDAVSRVYPRDIADAPMAIVREMFLSRARISAGDARFFLALREINLSLARGQRLGVLGGHRSGKSSLAGIASGVLAPTGGCVQARAPRLLLSRPTAGFKPTLSALENLRLRGVLGGMRGAALAEALERTLERCGVGRAEASRPVGNLSPHVVKQLALVLLMEVPAEILVVDDIAGAGIGAARWETRSLLQERVRSGTTLVVGTDAAFLQDVLDEAVLLHAGRLFGPFALEQAFEHFRRLPVDAQDARDDAAYDPLQPPCARTGVGRRRAPLLASEDDLYDDAELDSDAYAQGEDDEGPSPDLAPLPADRAWRLMRIEVDGEEFVHARASLVRHPGQTMRVRLELQAEQDGEFVGGQFALFGGISGLELARHACVVAATPVARGGRGRLCFDLTVPDWKEDFYGLAFCPGETWPVGRQQLLKVLIVGVGQRHARLPERVLAIGAPSFEKLNDEIDER